MKIVGKMATPLSYKDKTNWDIVLLSLNEAKEHNIKIPSFQAEKITAGKKYFLVCTNKEEMGIHLFDLREKKQYYDGEESIQMLHKFTFIYSHSEDYEIDGSDLLRHYYRN